MHVFDPFGIPDVKALRYQVWQHSWRSTEHFCTGSVRRADRNEPIAGL